MLFCAAAYSLLQPKSDQQTLTYSILQHTVFGTNFGLFEAMVHGKVGSYLLLHGISTVSLVIAHPDDEIMFFNQFLLSLNSLKDDSVSLADLSEASNTRANAFSQLKINVICLTNGDNENKYGEIRTKELIDSCRTILSNFDFNSNLFVHVGKFKDSMTEIWDISLVHQYLSSIIDSEQNNLVVSFDEYGISNHINHRTCNEVVKKHFLNSKTHFWALKTPGILQKYTGFLSLLATQREAEEAQRVVLTNSDFYQLIFLIGVMGCKHRSQMVWYRWLWWLFNSLAWSSTFEIVHFPKKEN